MGDRERDIEAIRAFNRIYTERLGLLRPKLDRSPFSLSEARLLYELAQGDTVTAAELSRTLGLDPAQISRTLKRFAGQGLIETTPHPGHGKRRVLSLTQQGQAAFAALERNTRATIGGLVDSLPAFRARRLVAAAEAIASAFEASLPPVPHLRSLRPGDLGLVTARQAILYARDYGWNAEYEALVARILADFQESFCAERDAAWIAELDGEMVGSIFLVHGGTADVGKLRLLYVEPHARGLGIGKLLVATCIAHARALGYARLDLWTNSVLVAARGIYERAGFRLVGEEPHHSFGQDLVGQIWSCDLRTGAGRGEQV
ncbi:bifunctional helix-turn-helix transcriptional regulator/GNAT family N-acetyltransferase [Allosphingosinicella deserti]|uniref:MarR family transcriptional regulator n=1 Tax=Allosphingosinicella deserti TaxID=2116704 RepID=A0A2P7QF02_9SPHN|nr:helix-turn-helix domain-containing GNAT family N-acetyltransferase [Sphingomonas deserti]PSJ36514.1 MarR family transcriptional regulator [Sphingomonas deserti]